MSSRAERRAAVRDEQAASLAERLEDLLTLDG